MPLTVALGQQGTGNREAGLPFFYEHFKPQDYQHNPQNWGVVQDERGIIYVANYDGVLEYDGASWRFIETATNTVVRSLDLGVDGIVYVGTSSDFGYLAPDSSNTLRYHSLIDKVAVEDREFSDVWGTHATSEGVYFHTFERLFRWDGAELKAWKSEGAFRTSFVVRDQLYVRDKGIGLLQVTNDILHLAPGGEAFADRYVYMMAPFGEDHILVGTSNAGFFDYGDGVATPFPTEADQMLEKFRLYYGCALPGNLYALATLGGGVLLIDQQGRLIQVLNKDTGMPDNWVNHLYADAQGGLWMSLDAAGIVRIDIPSQLTTYDDRLDLHGTINVMQRHQGTLYVGTSTGLVKLHRPDPVDGWMSSSFEDVLPGLPTAGLLSADSILFVATHEGLIGLREGTQERLVLTNEPTFTLLESRVAPGQIFVGKKDGLARASYTSTGWHVQDLYYGKTVSDEIQSIAEEADGTLWLGAADGTVLRFRFSEHDGVLLPERFTQKEGLPRGGVSVRSVGDQVVFFADRGAYRFDAGNEGSPHFRPASSLLHSADTLSAAAVHEVTDGDDGSVWTVYEDYIDIASPQDKGTYMHERPPVLRFPKANEVVVYVEKDGIAWIGSGNQLVRYDPSVQKNYAMPFSAMLRRVVATRTERVIYGGAAMDPGDVLPPLHHTEHDLRFEVSALSFNDVAANQYQYFLEGHDKAWSEWTSRANRTYNDLWGGAYTLRVRARNAQGIVSDEMAFVFQVLPPWYRTGWAYLVYLLAALAVTAFSWHHYNVLQENKRAQAQARELERERLVNERLQQANKRLQEANERERLFNQRLQEANESLLQANQLKDEFLANTSHELRTPLTAILGFSQLLKEELPSQYHELLDPISENGKRLLQTLNLLLDVARIRAGMLEVELEPIDVSEKTAEIFRLLTPLAHQKKLSLELIAPPAPVFAMLDQRGFEQILTNLIGNALKFTEVGGVTVEVAQKGERVSVRIADTGIGIAEEFLPHLFEEFKQESTGIARSHEGNGLGLAITARLVELLGGAIEVRSSKGKGSIFTVSFPATVPDSEETEIARPLRLHPPRQPARSHPA